MTTAILAATTTQTDADKALLTKLEAIIQKSQTAFFDAAKAVLQIIEGKLYGVGGKAAYFEERWGFDRHELGRYENAGRVLTALEAAKVPAKNLPKNEGQCRELHNRSKEAGEFNPERAVTLWTAVLELKEKPTAKLIEKTAKTLWPVPGASGAVPETVGELGPAVASVARSTSPEAAETSQEEPPVRATLIIKTEGQEGFGSPYNFDGYELRTVRDGEHELTIEGKSRREVLKELAEWAALSVCREVTVRFG